MLAVARSEAADLLADHTATQVRANLKAYDLDKARQEATTAIATTLADLDHTVSRRHAESDSTGQSLADAGIRPGQWINGVRYLEVRSLFGTGRVVPGQFNVEVEDDDGTTCWLSSTGSARDTSHETDSMIQDVLNGAVSLGGRKLATRAINAGPSF